MACTQEPSNFQLKISHITITHLLMKVTCAQAGEPLTGFLEVHEVAISFEREVCQSWIVTIK